MSINDERELTSFKEQVISTGSNISFIFLIILFKLFIIQAIRKIYDHYQLQSQLDSIECPDYSIYSYEIGM